MSQSASVDRTHPATTLPQRWPVEDLEAVERCPLCGGAARTLLYGDLTDGVFFTAPGRWVLHRCLGCESAYLDPRPTAEAIGRAYRSYYTHEPLRELVPARSVVKHLKRALRNGYLNARYNFDLHPALSWARYAMTFLPSIRLRFDRMARHLPIERRGARILDVGCGNGAFVRDATSWGWNAEGLDPDPNAAAFGRQFGVRIVTGGLQQNKYPDQFFAGVTLDHSIEHLHSPIAALREVYRILEPGGAIWIATPNLNSIGHGWFDADWIGLDPPRHLILFTQDALISALRLTGFEEIERKRVPFAARFYFTSSYRVALGEDQLAVDGSRLPLAWRWRATIADWQAFLRPRLSEELIVVARRPWQADRTNFPSSTD
jgi:SAM-dependent methyltransferase